MYRYTFLFFPEIFRALLVIHTSVFLPRDADFAQVGILRK